MDFESQIKLLVGKAITAVENGDFGIAEAHRKTIRELMAAPVPEKSENKLIETLKIAMRQWKMHIEENNEEDIFDINNNEAELYRECEKVLSEKTPN